jgi:hypothetical protein
VWTGADPVSDRPVVSIASGGASGLTLRHIDLRQLPTRMVPVIRSANGADRLRLDDLAIRVPHACATFESSDDLRIDGTTFTQMSLPAGTCLTLAGGARPQLRRVTVDARTGRSEMILLISGSGTATISDSVLRVDPAVTEPGYAVASSVDVAISRSRIDGTFAGVELLGGAGGSIDNSVITQRYSEFPLVYPGAVRLQAPAVGRLASLSVRNSTVIGRSSGSSGLVAATRDGGSTKITGVNDVLRGASSAVATEEPICDTTCGTAAIDLSYSNVTAGWGGTGPFASSQGHNQSTNPLFADETAGDFHPLPGSPLIDAGGAVPDGDRDLDGVTRPRGAAPDIGAYESSAPAPPDPGGSGTTSASTGTTHSTTGTTGSGPRGVTVATPAPVPPVPVLFGLRLAPATFRAASSGPRATTTAAVGTVISYSANVAGLTTLTFAVWRKGNHCAPPTTRPVPPASCTRLPKKGSMRRETVPGVNRVPFTGRVGGKALTPGRYRLTLIVVTPKATSVPVTKTFTIVR